MNLNVRELILSKYSEPSFFVNFNKIVRPTSTKTDNFTYKIQKNNKLNCWKIQDQELIKVTGESVGIFFDCQSYILQCLFDLKIDNTILEEVIVYFWKGQHAAKGYSPLPPELEEDCPVERIVQWSEPAIFFYGFPRTIFTFSGQEDIFNINVPHLLLVRGELVEEFHLFEVPCKKQNLRSRSSFLLVVPNEKHFLFWHGSRTSIEHRENIVKIAKPHNILMQWQENWSTFSVKEMEETRETTMFLDSMMGDISYFPVQLSANFSPKLFYLNTITGSFLATEVEYPLRAENIIAPFPFLQSHLYTATQPALFLLDNHTKVWLWEGENKKENQNDGKRYKQELRLAEELVKNYVEEKEKLLLEKVASYRIYAKKEPLEFKNIFPFWKDNEL